MEFHVRTLIRIQNQKRELRWSRFAWCNPRGSDLADWRHLFLHSILPRWSRNLIQIPGIRPRPTDAKFRISNMNCVLMINYFKFANERDEDDNDDDRWGWVGLSSIRISVPSFQISTQLSFSHQTLVTASSRRCTVKQKSVKPLKQVL